MARHTLHGASKEERLAARNIPNDARCVLEHANGSACYTYETAGAFYAIAFWGTAGRSLWHYRYRTDERRNQAILDFRESVEDSVERRAKLKADKAAWTNPLKVGDILHTCWGYDQTNTEFFAVTRVSGRRVLVREIAADFEGTGFMSGKTWPAMPIRFVGDETMHTAQPCGKTGVYVKIDECRTAYPEQGREHYVSSYA